MKIRTAIIGYGRSGSTMHANPIEKNSDFTMAAVCDIDPERRALAQARFACPVYDDYRQMLRDEKPALAVVVTRSDQHAAMVCDALDSGTHVLVTKPWAVNAAEARQMIAAAKRSGRLLLPWLPARWGCDLLRLRQLLAAGAIGRVFAIRRTVNSFGTRCDWQTERRYGGGYVLNWGPHIVDPPILLAGSPARSVYARVRQVINPGDAEDLFHAVITLADGTIVHAEYTVSLENFPSWVVQGDRGTITVRGHNLKMIAQAPQRPTDPTAFATMQAEPAQTTEEQLSGAPYGDEHAIYREIAAAVSNRKPYPVTTGDALELSRVLDAIKDSSHENRVITL